MNEKNPYVECLALKWTRYHQGHMNEWIGGSLATTGVPSIRERVRRHIFMELLPKADMLKLIGQSASDVFESAIEGVKDVVAELEKMAKECQDECDKQGLGR